MQVFQRQKGFTIVELLIVIVVIGILAAITITAFNGVQQKARGASASTAATTAKEKILAYQVDNGVFPLTGNLAAAGVSNNGSIVYQYTSDGSTFCVTASNTTISYYASSTTNTASGVCAGQTNPAATGFNVGYDFTGSNYTPTATSPNLTASAISVNAAANMNLTTYGSGYSTAPALSIVLNNSGSTDAASAISTGSYWTLTLTPGSGKTMSLSNLAFTIARGGGATPRGVVIRSSADNYTANLYSQDAATARPTLSSVSVDLSSIASTTSAVTFRFYVYTPSNSQSVDFDDIYFTGSTQ